MTQPLELSLCSCGSRARVVTSDSYSCVSCTTCDESVSLAGRVDLRSAWNGSLRGHLTAPQLQAFLPYSLTPAPHDVPDADAFGF